LRTRLTFALALALVLSSACSGPVPDTAPPPAPTGSPPPTQPLATERVSVPGQPTPLPTRTRWQFGALLPYAIQSGDTLRALAAHFNTTVEAIRQANPGLGENDQAILPPGRPLQIPANYAPLTGAPYHIIPDSELVYSPGQAKFSLRATILEQNGFLSRYSEYADDKTRSSWEAIERVALDYSINPRLLLALVEYRTGALTQPGVSDFTYPFGHADPVDSGMYKQLVWAAERLSYGYYGWRSGAVTQVTTQDGFVERLDFWQNAGTAALHELFADSMNAADFKKAISPEGFGAVYARLFGEPFKFEVTLYPAYTQQPQLELPFLPGRTWSFTGGPHPAWGDQTPWAALDFAPPAVGVGCGYSNEPVTAMAPGVVVRSSEAAVVLDLDGDGNEHTGWTIFYYHMGLDALPPVGKVVATGDALGHGSCDGGKATGTHVHVVRRFNGEWVPADGPLPFVLSGWTAHSEGEAYKGSLTYDLPALKIEACVCVAANNAISH
jgi:LasA protease